MSNEIELFDIFLLNFKNERIFFEVSKINEKDGSVGIYEIETKKYKNGIGLKKPTKPSRKPKIIKENNCMTKTNYFVHPVMLEKDWLLPIEIDGWVYYATYVSDAYNLYWAYNENCGDEIWRESCGSA